MIGLKQRIVKLEVHKEEWITAAKQTIETLNDLLNEYAVDIQHVGSTSIPMIKAKPVIDLVAIDTVLVNEGYTKSTGISFEMEKVLSQMPDNNQAMKAGRILEINADHPIFNALESAYKTKGDVSQYAELLYNQALLIEGFSIEDPVKFSNLMCDLMIQANK